ncbi:MAG: hypothetical protein ACRENB_04225 [Gemmatimonadales bacterium]
MKLLAATLVLTLAGSAAAQQPAQPAAPPQEGTPLAVGADAPDFTLSGATKEGLTGPITLSGLRDKTVVIAFFFRARTRG